MQDKPLFLATDNRLITSSDLLRALLAVKAQECALLYLHSALVFGQPHPALNRTSLLEALLEVLLELGVPTLCVPTYTFSFCNGLPYDVQHSRSKMGVLNEYIRTRAGAIRSVDPLMSNALLGRDVELVEKLGHASLGDDSTFARLHARQGVKFLFFGARLGECFTYSHFVEERLAVPYRYHRAFTGAITNQGHSYEDTYTLFVRYHGVLPSTSSTMEDYLRDEHLLLHTTCGDGTLTTIDEGIAYDAYAEKIRADVNFMLDPPYPHGELSMEFHADNMVAL